MLTTPSCARYRVGRATSTELVDSYLGNDVPCHLLIIDPVCRF
jgi:hypothetical protein